MPTTFETQFTRAAASLDTAFGASVVIERDGNSSAAFTARRENYVDKVAKPQPGFQTKTVERIYKLPQASIDFGAGGGVERPQVSDRITDNGEVFEIMPGDNMPAVQFDKGLAEFTVHTKQVS